MATVNNRTGLPQAMSINGVDAGGGMSASIKSGYDNVIRSSPDGLQVPMKDKECQFVRGSVVTQDWVEAINLLTGAVSTYVFYERKSGVAEATGFIKHTITNPVIHKMNLRFQQGGYATASFDFECRFASETATLANAWAMTDTQNVPTYITAARGGYRITSALHGALAIHAVTSFDFSLNLPLVKACNDSDIGYTCVDARVDGLTADGSINFQDSGITSTQLLAQQLLVAARASLVVTVVQSQGATAKVITIAGVDFNSIGSDPSADKMFTEYSAAFEVSNNTTTQLTLAGSNKIIAIV